MKIDYQQHWHNVKEDSKDFEYPALYKDFFKEPLCTEQEIIEAFQNWAKEDLEYAKNTCRIFAGGGLNYSYVKQVKQQPPSNKESLEDYYYKYFNNQQVGIFLDKVERFHEGITKRVAKIVQPLADSFGYPQFQCNITILLGKYGYTPFGIHYDYDDGRVVHTVINESKKSFYFWEKEKLLNLTNSTDRNYYDVDEWLPYSDVFTLGRNDFFLLPFQHFHIGQVEEFSIGLGITIQKINKSTIIRQAVNRFYKQQLEEHLPVEPSNFLAPKPNYLVLNGIQEKMPKGWMMNAIQETILKSESNLGFNAQPQSKSLPNNFDLLSSNIKLNSPFKITYLVAGKNLDIYVRKRLIQLYNATSIINFLDTLNNRRIIKVSSLIETLKEDMEIEDAYMLLKLFFEYGGIEFC